MKIPRINFFLLGSFAGGEFVKGSLQLGGTVLDLKFCNSAQSVPLSVAFLFRLVYHRNPLCSQVVFLWRIFFRFVRCMVSTGPLVVFGHVRAFVVGLGSVFRGWLQVTEVKGSGDDPR